MSVRPIILPEFPVAGDVTLGHREIKKLGLSVPVCTYKFLNCSCDRTK